MRLSRMYMLLGAVAAIGGVAYTFATNAEVTLSVRTVGGLFGRIFAIFVVSSLLPTIWAIIRRKHLQSANGPALLGILVAISFVGFGLKGAFVERDLRKFVFSPGGCSHRVTFPQAPEINDVVLAGSVKVVQANLYTAESFIRAECIPTAGKVPKSEAELERQIKILAGQNGLSNYEHRMEVRKDGIYGFVRGTKMVSGKWVTYSLVLVLSDASFMGLTNGSASEIFPTRIISEFLKSIQPA